MVQRTVILMEGEKRVADFIMVISTNYAAR
jgi:hypothetical protein